MLATVTELSEFKPLQGEGAMARAMVVLKAVDGWFRFKIGEDPEYAETTERVDGDGYSSFLLLGRWPIKSVTSLTVTTVGVFGSLRTSTPWSILGDTGEDTGQEAVIGKKGACLESRFQPWPEGSRNIQVTYFAGFTSLELANAKTAVMMLTHLVLREPDSIGLGQVSLGDMQIQQIVRNPKDYQFIMEAIDGCKRRFI